MTAAVHAQCGQPASSHSKTYAAITPTASNAPTPDSQLTPHLRREPSTSYEEPRNDL